MTCSTYYAACQIARNLGPALNVTEPFDTLPEEDLRRVWLLQLAQVALASLDALTDGPYAGSVH